MQIIIAIVGLILLIVGFETSYYILHHDNDKPKNRRKLKYPMSFRILPLLVFITTGCLSIISIITKNEEWLITLISSIIIEIPTFLLFVCFSLWTVEVFEDRFMHRNFFGRKRTYLFREIEERRTGKWYSKITQKKICTIAYYVPNAGILRRSYKKYSLRNKNQIED